MRSIPANQQAAVNYRPSEPVGVFLGCGGEKGCNSLLCGFFQLDVRSDLKIWHVGSKAGIITCGSRLDLPFGRWGR